MKKCSHTSGFYLKIQTSYRLYYDENGEIDGSDNGDSDMTAGRGGTVAYCADCDKRLGGVVLKDAGHKAVIV